MYQNHIFGTVGTEAGYGYGIHLANAYSCTVNDNYIEHSTRHAIYNAWGNGNAITDNIIKEHWKNVGMVNPPSQQPSRGLDKTRAALAVYRKSVGITISGNSFIDSFNTSIALVSIPDVLGQNYDTRKYGMMTSIAITGNSFTHTGPHDTTDTNINHKHPAIKIGEAMSYENIQTGFLINQVLVKDNSFYALNSDFLTFCHIYQCNNIELKGNSLTFSSYNFNSPIIHLLVAFNNANINYLTMNVNVLNNTFVMLNTSPQTYVTVSAFSDVSAHFNSGSQMTILNNTLVNQYVSGIQMYQLYYNFNATAYGTLPSGFVLQLES